MQITSRTNRRSYWATVAVGVGIGVIYLAGFAAGGKPLLGLGALGIMVAFSGALLLAVRHHRLRRRAGLCGSGHLLPGPRLELPGDLDSTHPQPG